MDPVTSCSGEQAAIIMAAAIKRAKLRIHPSSLIRPRPGAPSRSAREPVPVKARRRDISANRTRRRPAFPSAIQRGKAHAAPRNQYESEMFRDCIGAVTSSAAPVLDMLRTMQVIALPPNFIVPVFSSRCRCSLRFSTMSSAERPQNLRKHSRSGSGVTSVVEMLVHQIDDEKSNDRGQDELHDRSITNGGLMDC